MAHFRAAVDGYEELEYTLQWQTSADNAQWEDIPDATGVTYDVVMTEENYTHFWRVQIVVKVPEAPAMPDAEQPNAEQPDAEQPNAELPDTEQPDPELPDPELPAAAPSDPGEPED